MPDALVTGASGFIGGAIASQLIADGHVVRTLARSDESCERAARLGAEVVRGDLLDPASLAAAATGCDVVFHVAGVNRMCSADPTEMYRANVDGAINVVRAASAAGARRVVLTSSAATIGEPRGTVGTEVTEHRGHYLSPYERSKHHGEVAAFAEAERLGVDLVAVNPSSVHGPGRTGGTARILLAYLRGRLRFAIDGRVSLVFIDDCVQAHLGAAAVGRPGARYLVSGTTITVRQAIDVLRVVAGLGRRVTFVPAALVMPLGGLVGLTSRLMRRDPPLCREMARTMRHGHAYDGSHSADALGFSYTPINEALAATLDWYRAEGLV